MSTEGLAISLLVLTAWIVFRVVQWLRVRLDVLTDPPAAPLFPRSTSTEPEPQPPGVNAVEALLLAASDHDRAADKRLRPRLAELDVPVELSGEPGTAISLDQLDTILTHLEERPT